MNKSRGKNVWADSLIIHILFGAVIAALFFIAAVIDGTPALRISIAACGVLLAFLYALNRRFARKRFVQFTQDITGLLDGIIKGKDVSAELLLKETLDSKISAKLQRVIEITHGTAQQSNVQRENVERLVSDISHQLKTPLTNIKMAAETLQGGVPKEKEGFFLQGLSAQVNKLEFLIDALVKISRLENGIIQPKPSMNKISPVILTAVNAMKAKADECGIQIEYTPEDIALYLDEKWTAEVLENILDNAIKYTPYGGKIQISVSPLAIYTRIDIRDNGIGILPEHLTDVYKRFYRENRKPNTSGAGIGLYLVRKILTMQKGYVTIQSVPQQGTTVSVHLLNRPE